jgi:hypothetical protein
MPPKKKDNKKGKGGPAGGGVEEMTIPPIVNRTVCGLSLRYMFSTVFNFVTAASRPNSETRSSPSFS